MQVCFVQVLSYIRECSNSAAARRKFMTSSFLLHSASLNDVITSRSRGPMSSSCTRAFGIFYLLSIGVGATARVNRSGGCRARRRLHQATLIGTNRTASRIMQMPREPTWKN